MAEADGRLWQRDDRETWEIGGGVGKGTQGDLRKEAVYAGLETNPWRLPPKPTLAPANQSVEPEFSMAHTRRRPRGHSSATDAELRGR